MSRGGTAQVGSGRKGRAARLPAEQRRIAILDSATEVFSARGYAAVSTVEIAAAAEVSEPTLYRYFPSKRALYLAVLERNAAALMGTWREIANSSPTPLEALRAIGRWYFLEVMRDPRPYLLRARALLETDDEQVASNARARFSEAFEFINSIYEQARSEGYFDAAADTRSFTWVFMSVGTLIDHALLMNMRLEIDELRRIMAVLGPVLLAPEDENSAAAAGRSR